MGFEANTPKLVQAFARASALMAKGAEQALKQSGQEFQREMTLRRFQSYRLVGPRPDDRLNSRSGMLKKSIGYRTSGSTLGDLSISVFSSGLAYSNLQEYGGTITPKKGKYLAIPLRPALAANGVSRRGGPRAYPDGFFFTSKKGNLLFGITKGKGKNAQIVPLFLLKDRVTVPPRLGFRKTWISLADQRLARIKAGMQAGLARAFGGVV